MARRGGLSTEQVLAIAEAQGMMCPLSKVKFERQGDDVFDPTTGRRACIDHDHATGLVRGILIEKVNLLIDQWDKKTYGALSIPQEILDYKANPPAQRVFPNLMYVR